MTYKSNEILSKYKNENGHVKVMATAGSFLDVQSDIFFDDQGRVTFRHEGFRANGPIAGMMNAHYKGEIFLGVMCDAMIYWDRHMNPEEDDEDDYGWGEAKSEYMMLHGCD